MFIPNARAYWLKKAAKRSITGKETFLAPRLIPISVVSLKDSTAASSVRADSSASRGAADEHIAAAKILVPPQFILSRGDVIRIGSSAIEITGVTPRWDVFGKLDHQEIDGDIRADL